MKADEDEIKFEKIPNKRRRQRPTKEREYRERWLHPSNRNVSCRSGKVGFPTHEAALRRAGKILADQSHPSGVKQLWSYKCKQCGSWHLTKQDQSKR